jgi:diguanylate cyclase (GGDEF)-like protein
MNTLNKVGSPRQEALEVVIAELERSLVIMEANYQKAVSNLSTLRRCVDTDDLTRLLRRGAFMRKLQNLLSESSASGREVTLMMIDVDHFKKVNDGYGHQAGDAVLERVSELVRGFMRPTDLAGRYGGEEIIVAMQATHDEARTVAESIRKAVERERMLSPSRVEFTVTLSAGVASTRNIEYEAGVLIGHADEALYRAKNTGRNRVVLAEQPGRAVELLCEAA